MAQSTPPLSNALPPSPLTSILNFRDISRTINDLNPESPPRLKPNLIYRSARPDEATPTDRSALISTYHIKTIMDLRSETEHIESAKKKLSARRPKLQATDADKKNSNLAPSSSADTTKIAGITYAEINLNGGTFSRALFWKLSWYNMSKLLLLMWLGYRLSAIGILGREVMAPRGLTGLGQDSLEFCKSEIQACFAVLADVGSYPVLIHCTQGKDRTGLVVLLVLLLLGVPVQAISTDYGASERELEGERESRMKEISSIGLGEEFASCPVGFVDAMKGFLDERWGGVEQYLEACGIDGQMREIIKGKLLVDGEE